MKPTPMKRPKMMDRTEMREILVSIARGSDSAIARIQSIKVLRDMDAEDRQATEDGKPTGREDFDQLYQLDEHRRRRGHPPQAQESV